MTQLTPTRQAISQAIATLPAEVLADLASFIEYLQFKTNSSSQQHGQPKSNSFLMAIAGLGESDEIDLSERDEEILATEINQTLEDRDRRKNQCY